MMQNLILVHGFLGGSGQWAAQVNAFSRYFNVVAVDLPGFGLKSGLPAPERIGDYADSVLAELSSLGIKRFHLLGHSMGGMIVQEMTARAPERIESLVLYGTGPIGMMPGRFESIEESRRRASEDGAQATGRRIAATWFLQGEMAEHYPVCEELAVKASLQAILAGLTAMENWSGLSALAKITVPTLVLWGDSDRAYLWNQPEQLWRKIPGAQLAVIPGCAHAVHLEKPHLFNAMLEDFLLTSCSEPS